MINLEELRIFFEQQSSDSFTRHSAKLDRDGNFYHVTQQGYNYLSVFNSISSKYRIKILYSECEKNNVIPLCNVIMPNHTHDLFFSENFENITKVMRYTNSAFVKFVKKEKSEKGKDFSNEKVFMTSPSYERITEMKHLFFLFKYFYDNPKYLKDQNIYVPFSCFDSWERGYFKPYRENLYLKLFDKTIEQITSLCQSLTKEEFRKLSDEQYGNRKI